jgi:hypothetical protein
MARPALAEATQAIAAWLRLLQNARVKKQGR